MCGSSRHSTSSIGEAAIHQCISITKCKCSRKLLKVLQTRATCIVEQQGTSLSCRTSCSRLCWPNCIPNYMRFWTVRVGITVLQVPTT
jgi:hypothetical protein